jgi:choline dehydrogenase-like flavoprotein
VKKGCDQMGIPCVSSRMSIITESLNNRPPCHYCGQCNRGCSTGSNFSSPDVLLRPALDTGRLTIITQAMVREVTVDAAGRATGFSYIDKTTGQDEHVQAEIVVLAASACSSSRILLNSKSSLFPDGLANSSGLVGKYLTDTTGTGVSAHFPAMRDPVAHNEDGVGGAHVYMPWWGDNSSLDFPRGYHVEVYGGLGVPSAGFGGGMQRYTGGGYGADLKQAYRSYYGTTIGFSGRGEMIPNEESFCEVDPEVVDQWGIPALRFHWEHSEHEVLQVKHMQETFRELLTLMGGEVRGSMPGPERGYGIDAGGRIIHELGGARMGADPANSVVDAECRAHDVPNLFIADGAPFVTQPHKNPTWTILALAMRTSDGIARLRNQGDV